MTPADPKLAEEVTKLASSLEATYGRGKWCKDPAKPDDLPRHREDHRDHGDLARPGAAPRSVGGLAHDFAADAARLQRFVELANIGARELGFADTGAMWRLKYDMPADDFTQEVDRLWDQVRPLYVSLHAYVRMKLHEKYGDLVPAAGRCRRICSAISGRRTGRTCSSSSPPGSAEPGLLR